MIIPLLCIYFSEPSEETSPETSPKTSPDKRRPQPGSPVKATKAQLKEQKILEKKREMRRQRSLNKRYFSDDFASPVQDKLKESLKMEEASSSKATESLPMSPVKMPVTGKVKPRVLSFSIRFRERRVPQVESHFLLCSCLSGEQQKKMSSRKQKQKSKREGKQKSKFTFIAKMEEKQNTKIQQQRGRLRKTDDDGRLSDISRSSTPVQDEMPVEPIDTTGPRRGRRRQQKLGDDEQRGGDSRSSTPVQDEVQTLLEDVTTKQEVSKQEG